MSRAGGGVRRCTGPHPRRVPGPLVPDRGRHGHLTPHTVGRAGPADTTATPLERPAQFAGQEFFTDEERAELDEQRAALRRFDTRSEAGTPLDVAGAYNAVYQSVKKTGRRTSLIVDPPDGRVPPLTAAGRQRVDADRRGRASFEELGGSYGTERMNRADGPEDRGRAERCLGNRLPALGGYSRIVQSPGYVAILL